MKELKLHRSAYVIMVDTSVDLGQMITLDGSHHRMGDLSVKWLNEILVELLYRAHGTRSIMDCYDVAVIFYSGRGMQSCYGNVDDPFVSIVDLQSISSKGQWLNIKTISPLDSPDDYDMLAKEDFIVEFSGSRPMYEAYSVVHEALQRWCLRASQRGEIYLAPTVINIAGGIPTDCSIQAMVEISEQIKAIKGSYGEETLMLNTLLDSSITTELIAKYSYIREEVLSQCPNAMVRALSSAASIIPSDMLHSILPAEQVDGECQPLSCMTYGQSIAGLLACIMINSRGDILE